MVISLVFKDNDTLHDDLILSIGGQEFVCDTYYLALDREVPGDREDAGKIRLVLARILEQWLDALNRLADGGTAYLPYDFSDQYTGWVRCRRLGEEVSVSRGWALVEGWAITPSAPGDLFSKPHEFRVDGPTVRTTLRELLEAVHHSLAAARG